MGAITADPFAIGHPADQRRDTGRLCVVFAGLPWMGTPDSITGPPRAGSSATNTRKGVNVREDHTFCPCAPGHNFGCLGN
jgi:hypothetical protein